VILLTRLGGQPMALNPDLIEKAEATPDTVITMVDGHKMVVADSVAEVIEKVRTWRASVAASAFTLSNAADTGASTDAVHGLDEPLGDVAADGTGLARVLRMPAREE